MKLPPIKRIVQAGENGGVFEVGQGAFHMDQTVTDIEARAGDYGDILGSWFDIFCDDTLIATVNARFVGVVVFQGALL